MSCYIAGPVSGFCAALLVLATGAAAAEYRVEAFEGAPPEDVAKEIADALAPQGYRVASGKSRVLCEIWLAKSWPVKKFTPTDAVHYPFEPGQLIGVVRYQAKGADFRDQELAKGVYTLRYAQQPVDGNHVGTSPTRDFLLLSAAAKDKSAKAADPKALAELSALAAESKHPAMLALKKAVASDKPAVTHDEAADLWLLQLTGSAGGKLPIAIVVVGHAAE